MSSGAQRRLFSVIGECVRRPDFPCRQETMRDREAADMCRVFGVCMTGAEEWLPPEMTDREMWSTCARGEWLLGAVAFLHVAGVIPRQVLTLAACAAARTALVGVPENQRVPVTAISAAEAWARGEGSELAVRLAMTASDMLVLRTKNFGNFSAVELAACAASDAAVTAIEEEFFAPSLAQGAASIAAIYSANSAIDAVGEDADRRSTRSAEIADALRSTVPWSIVEPALQELLKIAPEHGRAQGDEASHV